CPRPPPRRPGSGRPLDPLGDVPPPRPPGRHARSRPGRRKAAPGPMRVGPAHGCRGSSGRGRLTGVRTSFSLLSVGRWLIAPASTRRGRSRGRRTAATGGRTGKRSVDVRCPRPTREAYRVRRLRDRGDGRRTARRGAKELPSPRTLGPGECACAGLAWPLLRVGESNTVQG